MRHPKSKVVRGAFQNTAKGGSRRLEKSHEVRMVMMSAAGLMWAGPAEKREQLKVALKS